MALARLTFVTGKGGSGKTTVAAALATALARQGPTILASLGQRFSAARLLGADLNGSGPLQIGKNLEAAALSPRTELESFIGRILPLRTIARRMLKSRTFGHVTAALPGLEAFLILERLRIMEGEKALEGGFAVVDAPATGGALQLLSAVDRIKKIAPLGTLNRLAAAVESMVIDPSRFGVMLTARPEELAVREALEAAGRLRKELGISAITVVLNGVPDALFNSAEMDVIGRLGEHGRLAGRRLALAQCAARAIREFSRAGLAVVQLPMIFETSLGRSSVLALGRRLESAVLKR